jgi:hypothetical protein
MPKQVPVEVLESFDAKMEEIKEFMLRQDVYSAARRGTALEEEAYELFVRLSSFPHLGHEYNPRILPRDVDAQKDLEWARKVKENLSSDELLEISLQDYNILYLYSETGLLILSIRHQRSKSYKPADL